MYQKMPKRYLFVCQLLSFLGILSTNSYLFLFILFSSNKRNSFQPSCSFIIKFAPCLSTVENKLWMKLRNFYLQRPLQPPSHRIKKYLSWGGDTLEELMLMNHYWIELVCRENNTHFQTISNIIVGKKYHKLIWQACNRIRVENVKLSA